MARSKKLNTSALNNYLVRADKLKYNADEYITWCKGLSAGSIIYGNDVILLLEYCNKPIAQLTASELENYFIKRNPRKGTAYSMQNFLNFLNSNYNYSFNFDDVLIKYKPNKSKKSDEINTTIPLSMDQITILKAKLIENEENKTFFYLSLAYDHGATPEEFVNFTQDNFSYNDKCFYLPTRKFSIDSFLADFCQEHQEIMKKWGSDTNYHYNFRIKMSEALGTQVSYLIIKTTRDEHLIKCPRCYEYYLNDGKFWVVAIFENDPLKRQWIVCKSCAKEGENNKRN